MSALALTSCSSDEPVSVNRGRSIEFRAAMGSRGTATITDDLTDFKVTAFDNNSKVYFGDEAGETFTKQGTGDDCFFSSIKKYFWPAEGYLHFYAYHPTTLATSVSLTTDNKKLTGFTPDNKIADQIDFIAAYETQNKENGEDNGVELGFNHQLSQIEIKALSTNSEYTFEVSGVRIGRVIKTGTFDFSTLVNKDVTGKRFGTWYLNAGLPTKLLSNLTVEDLTASNLNTYTSEYIPEDYVAVEGSTIPPLTLDATPRSLMGKNGNAFLLPQKLTAWNRSADYTAYKAAESTSTYGTYLAVKVRITRTDSNPEVVIYPYKKGDEWCEWAAIPIGQTGTDGEDVVAWEPGKKYIYTLDFSTGAGYVDPTDPEPGKPILREITFKVQVVDWTEDTGDQHTVTFTN